MTTLPFKDLIARSTAPSTLGRAAGHALGRVPEQDGGIFSFGDLAAAPFRGLEGAARGVYDLADTLTFDALPDLSEERFLGRSRTMVGGFVEAAVQFGAAFIPGVGPGALAAKGVSAALKVGTLTGKAAVAGRLGTAAAAGAVADFTVFDAHEARLSNFLNEFPAISNPVTDYLAADPDDGEIEGRFKNALEGLGLGVLTDAVFQGVRAVAKGRKVRTKGGSPEEVAKAMEDAVDPAAIRESMRAAATEGSEIVQAAREKGRATDIDRALDPHREAVKAEKRPKWTDQEGVLRGLGLSPEKVQGVMKRTRERTELEGLQIKEGEAPRNQPPDERLIREITEADINLSNFAGPTGVVRLKAAMRTLIDPMARRELDSLEPVALAAAESRARMVVNDLLGAEDAFDRLGQWMEGGLKNARQATQFGMEIRVMTATVASAASKKLRAALNPATRNTVTRAEAVEAVTLLADTMATLKGVAAEAGRNTGQFRYSVSADAAAARRLDELLSSGAETGKGGRPIDPNTGKEVPKVDPTELEKNARTVLDTATHGRTLGGRGGDEALDRYLAMVQELIGDGTDWRRIGGFTNLIGPTMGRNATNMAVELWVNSLLSGARTWTINWVTPVMASVYVPLERVVGGAATMNSEAIRSGLAQLTGLFRDVDEAFRMGIRAAQMRRPQLLPQAGFHDPFARGEMAEAAVRNAQLSGKRSPGAFSSAVRGLDPESTAGKIGDFLDKFVPFPSAVIAGTDEFVKQLNFRSVARDEFMRDALAKGLSPEDAVAYTEDMMRVAIVDGQAFSRDRLYTEGLKAGRRQGLEGAELVEYAEALADQNMERYGSSLLPAVDRATRRSNEVTFQEALERGTFGRGIQDLVVAHPMLRLFVLPFVKTPTNIIKFAGRRVDITGPFQLMYTKKFGPKAPHLEEIRNRFVRDYLEGERGAKGGGGDPLRKADAIGRLTTGAGVVAMFGMLAGSGKITGRGPRDPERRRLLEEAGWRPYSLRVGDTWVEYRRLDPWASMLGLVADLTEYANWADTGQQGEVETALAATVAAVSNVFTQASYLTGIRNFADAMSDPNGAGSTWVRRMVGSLAVPNVVAQFTAPAGDEYFREARNLMESLARRVPGYSDELEPRRNLYGEPVKATRRLGQDSLGSAMNVWMPVAYTEVSDDVVDRALAELGHGFSPPKPVRGGLDLLEFKNAKGQTAFDRWSELHGSVTVGGRTIKQELRRLVTSAEYQKLPAESLPNVPSPRVAAVRRVISRFRDKAWDQTLREYPQMAQRYAALGGDRVRAFQSELARHQALRGAGSILDSVTGANPDRIRQQIQRRN